MKAVLSVAVMLTVAPLVAVTTLVCWEPERWGGSLNPLAIAVMALFGLLSVPLWPTYIPAIIITPLLMSWISTHRAFGRLSLPIFLGFSLLVGAVAGVCVMIPLILMALNDSSDSHQALAWMGAGAVSGAVTLTLICLLYRYEEHRAEQKSMQRMRASRSGHLQPPRRRRLALTADHVHDLDMVPGQTTYRATSGRHAALRFSKSGAKTIEDAYSRRYKWNQSAEKKRKAIEDAGPRG
jgi:hypothetical protein